MSLPKPSLPTPHNGVLYISSLTYLAIGLAMVYDPEKTVSLAFNRPAFMDPETFSILRLAGALIVLLAILVYSMAKNLTLTSSLFFGFGEMVIGGVIGYEVLNHDLGDYGYLMLAGFACTQLFFGLFFIATADQAALQQQRVQVRQSRPAEQATTQKAAATTNSKKK